MYLGLPSTLYALLTTLLWPPQPQNSPITFHLRHIHATTQSNQVLFTDVQSPQAIHALGHDSYNLRIPSTKQLTIPHTSATSFQSARRRSRVYGESIALDWSEDQVEGPDVGDKEVLMTLAKMTANAYFEVGDKDWYDLPGRWNQSFPFGWNPEDDGFRGHIFASEDNSIVIVSVKGTSAPWIAGGGGPTMKKDKLNDNLLFSCCCARVGPTWSPVCDCHVNGYRCEQTCVENALQEESLFYPIGINLYNNVTYMYPDANIWVIGHSLGGSLASLIGLTFGAPVVAFEAPGEAMAAKRLHLPSPPSLQHITHVYHTADPIAMGTCNGVSSWCAIGGYAMESRCHLGEVIRYDTVDVLKWGVAIQTHPIKVVLEQILSLDWQGDGKAVPEAKKAVEVEGEDGLCVDCFSWEFGNFKNSTKKRWRW
ncbi:alpha/beta-hydrolase [Macrolepiota fuliginosa MF-IS2]|uniref:triacylglycerol lipase n=1 Tax=Macrolepiota fuliginosa MF-IS2 TaxID=1400762 RepID=A0A9P6BZS8_9AGAR|nr:alpha/beta-hydrolase [Macrolepiota fuliginosa MF-IS2]